MHTHTAQISTNFVVFVEIYLGKEKTLAKEKHITQLNRVFLIIFTKDLQYIHPPKICMKCYLLMNTTSKRNSTNSLKTYENWCPHDEHSFVQYV